MTILDHVPHAARRKGYAAHYAPSNLALFEPEMHEFTLELVHVRLHNILHLQFAHILHT